MKTWPLILVTLLATDASGYAVPLHEELSRRSLTSDAWLLTPAAVDGASVADLTRFRRWLYEKASAHPDAEVRERFRDLFPRAEAFDALAFRRLMAFNQAPRRRIWSVDRARTTRGQSARELLAFASGAPDRDGRNRNRVRYKGNGKIERDVHGSPIPDDPATLNMGRATGLSSQAHAHYGLPAVDFSDDPDVLKSDPARFAIAAGYPDGPILALAAETTQAHADLALLATAWGGKGSRWLAVTFAGAGLHYLQDVGNQIHTVQVGLYDFFVDAKLQYWWRAFVTSGGYLATLPKFTSIGVGILRNHHVLIEQLTARRFFGGDLEVDFATDDPALAQALDPAVAAGKDGPAAAIVRALIEVSAPEGSQAYGLIREAACGRLRGFGYILPDDTEGEFDPEALVCDPETIPALMALQSTALRRVSTAIRRYDRELAREAASVDVDAVLGRLLRERLALLAAGEARREAFIASGAGARDDGERSPMWPIGQALVFGGFAFWFWRKVNAVT